MNKAEIDELIQLTKQLSLYGQEALQLFNEMKASTNDEPVDFFATVKPFADKVKATSDRWQLLSIKWINLERPKYLHELQIRTTYENLEIIAVQAFFKDTKQRRFTEMVQSIQYVLNDLLQRIKEVS